MQENRLEVSDDYIIETGGYGLEEAYSTMKKILEKKIIAFIQKNKFKNNESIPLNTISEIMQTYNSGNNYLLSGNSARFNDNNSSTSYMDTHGPKKMTRREMFEIVRAHV